MIEAIIITASLVAFAQLGLSCWRATLSGIAAQAISERVRVAAGITDRGIRPHDFRKIIMLKDLSPDLRGPNGSFTAIRAYYNVVEKLGNIVPGTAGWASAEMATCSRYAAFLMDQQLERNMVYATQLRGK
jgi:hypothetical protein